MTEKRFYIDRSGDLWDRQSKDILMQDFGYCEAIYVNAILDLLNGLYEENQSLKYKNELLSDGLEQCKAVINNRWKEYLDKKGDYE